MQSYTKKLTAVLLSVLTLFSSAVTAGAAYTPVTLNDITEAAESSASLTLDWYGDTDGIVFEEELAAKDLPCGVTDALALYRVFREGNFLKRGADSVALQRGLFAFSDVQAALDGYNARALSLDVMETRMKMVIKSAAVTLRLQPRLS